MLNNSLERTVITMTKETITLDELTRICGHFYTEPFGVNSGYNCNHPECDDGNEDDEGTRHGSCFSFTCPIAYPADDEEHGFNGDTPMIMIVEVEVS